jgi:soluble lytic murein transglycosylase-like protein
MTGVCSAADLAHLRNGFTIRHDRREVLGDKTRLYTAGGYVEVPTEEIVDYEHDDTPEPASAAAATPVKSIPDHVAEASKSTGIDPDFLNSVIHHESGFNPKAVSKKGARGLMQLMPQTADQLGVRDSFDPGQNIQGGAAYLRQLLVQYNGDAQKALAAYNAGPHRVQQYNGVPPYTETRAYVANIIREYNRKKLAEQKAAKVQESATTKKPIHSSKAAAKKSLVSKPAS